MNEWKRASRNTGQSKRPSKYKQFLRAKHHRLARRRAKNFLFKNEEEKITNHPLDGWELD